MKEDSSEKKKYSSQLHRRHYYTDRREAAPGSMCVSSVCVFCVFTFIPRCVEMTEGGGKRVRR